MMACYSFNPISGCNESFVKPKIIQKFYVSSDFHPNSSCHFMGQSLVVSNQKNLSLSSSSSKFSVKSEASYCVSKAMRWWEKTLQPNMIEIHSAQQFVHELQSAAHKLVIVEFYSPGCGGCKSLHPKICQLAESNKDAIFLQVNYEELKPMCHALHIHVLPFFRFYKGVEGRVCSFSCTISTIKKFKDALAKHNTESYVTFGPAKGLDETEMIKLASMGELKSNSPISTSISNGLLQELILDNKIDSSNPLNVVGSNAMLVT